MCVYVQVAGEDEVQLDEEMERVVWSEGERERERERATVVSGGRAEPTRDRAAPPPYAAATVRRLRPTAPRPLYLHLVSLSLSVPMCVAGDERGG